MSLRSAMTLKAPAAEANAGSPRLSKVWASLLAHRLVIYICAILFASVGAYGYWIRTHTIFACQADGYSADRYLAYCNGANYADYEHGAFEFNMEPSVADSLRNADVVFLGNSRVQVAFSTVPTQNWFEENQAKYYLLGFSYYENSFFEGRLLERTAPRASVYVINVEGFFPPVESVPVKMILHDPKARDKYETKRFLQDVHARICKALPQLCGKQFVIFRSRETGRYYTEGAVGPKTVPVSYDPVVDKSVASESIATAIGFLSRFAKNKCVILTIVPYVGTETGTARAIATGVGLKLVTPGIVEGLQTYDGYHLDQPSAQRWSQAFFQAAGPEIQSCLANRSAMDSQDPSPTGPAGSIQSAATTTAQ